MSDLTVVTVVENDPGLLDLMVRSVLRFTDPAPYFVFCDNSNSKQKTRIEKIMGSYRNYKIILNKPPLKGGSNRHGYGLNRAMGSVKTARVAIVESDVVVLHENWSRVHWSCKVKAAPKAEHVYHACFFICPTEIAQKIDWRPGKNDKDRASNRSYPAKYDVGWRIGGEINQKYTDPVEMLDCKTYTGTPFGKIQSDVFYHGKDLIAAHFGRGSNITGKAIRKGFDHPNKQLKKWKAVAENIIGQ